MMTSFDKKYDFLITLEGLNKKIDTSDSTSNILIVLTTRQKETGAFIREEFCFKVIEDYWYFIAIAYVNNHPYKKERDNKVLFKV